VDQRKAATTAETYHLSTSECGVLVVLGGFERSNDDDVDVLFLSLVFVLPLFFESRVLHSSSQVTIRTFDFGAFYGRMGIRSRFCCVFGLLSSLHVDHMYKNVYVTILFSPHAFGTWKLG